MKAKLIVMLTLNDKTITNACDVFEECRELPVEFWGFKNVGISEDKLQKLAFAIKMAKKKAVMEVVTYSEESCLAASKFAIENGIDYLIGSIYSQRAQDLLSLSSIQYFPYVGRVCGSPSVLSGGIKELVEDANRLCAKGVNGVNLLAYRNNECSPFDLAQEIVKQVDTKVIVAGSINSVARLKEINAINPWAFTMGGALFHGDFVEGSGIRANLIKVLDEMESII